MRLDLEIRTLVYFEGPSFAAPLRQLAPLPPRAPSCTSCRDHGVSPAFRAQSLSPLCKNEQRQTMCRRLIQVVSIRSQREEGGRRRREALCGSALCVHTGAGGGEVRTDRRRNPPGAAQRLHTPSADDDSGCWCPPPLLLSDAAACPDPATTVAGVSSSASPSSEGGMARAAWARTSKLVGRTAP